jgi:hypothetical protein
VINGAVHAETFNPTAPAGAHFVNIPFVTLNNVVICAPGCDAAGANPKYGPPTVKSETGKPAAPVTIEALTSRSRSGPPGTFVYGLGQEYVNTQRILAEGQSVRGAAGRAAGAAFDPITLEPAFYSNYQYSIDATITPDGTSSESLLFFAVDSRLFPNPELFYDSGEPLSESFVVIVQ